MRYPKVKARISNLDLKLCGKLRQCFFMLKSSMFVSGVLPIGDVKAESNQMSTSTSSPTFTFPSCSLDHDITFASTSKSAFAPSK